MAQYTRNSPLDEGHLAADPMEQLRQWLDAAAEAGMIEPTAMTLATADARGRPSARIVLFKGFHEGCPTFYSNYESAKGRALAENPFAALVFWWDKLERQVRIEGRVERLPADVSAAYFASRPRASQISAVASRQSQPVASRAELDGRMQAAEAELGDGEIPCPDYWGGYAVIPDRVEFWQGRHGRAHDRLVYLRAGERDWTIQRLQP